MSRRAVAALLLVSAACADDASPGEGPSVLPRDPSKPYVVTAIDYHFHDAHPTPPLAPVREVVISNQGSNVHNVTFGSLSRDIRPGERLVLGPLGQLVPGPGRHRFVCRYHLDRGMTGVLVMAGGLGR